MTQHVLFVDDDSIREIRTDEVLAA
jgi:hypothetical protein